MNETYVLGIDFGTESGRAMLVRAADGEGDLLSVSQTYQHHAARFGAEVYS